MHHKKAFLSDRQNYTDGPAARGAAGGILVHTAAEDMSARTAAQDARGAVEETFARTAVADMLAHRAAAENSSHTLVFFHSSAGVLGCLGRNPHILEGLLRVRETCYLSQLFAC